MNIAFGLRRFLIGATWALAMATWGSIGHFFLGTPELGMVIPIALGAAIAAGPMVKPLVVAPNRRAAAG